MLFWIDLQIFVDRVQKSSWRRCLAFPPSDYNATFAIFELILSIYIYVKHELYCIFVVFHRSVCVSFRGSCLRLSRHTSRFSLIINKN